MEIQKTKVNEQKMDNNPLFSVKDIITFSIEIMKKIPIKTPMDFLLILRDKLEEAAQERLNQKQR